MKGQVQAGLLPAGLAAAPAPPTAPPPVLPPLPSFLPASTLPRPLGSLGPDSTAGHVALKTAPIRWLLSLWQGFTVRQRGALCAFLSAWEPPLFRNQLFRQELWGPGLRLPP